MAMMNTGRFDLKREIQISDIYVMKLLFPEEVNKTKIWFYRVNTATSV